MQRIRASYNTTQNCRCPLWILQTSNWFVRKLCSRCFPHNYWFAKHRLDCALEVVAEWEEYPTALPSPNPN
jgi:hypothetical protein